MLSEEIQVDYADIVHAESLKKVSEVNQSTAILLMPAVLDQHD